MKTSEIKLMEIDEIKTKLLDSRNEYMTMRFQVVSGQLTDTSKLKIARRLISRYETILREKQMAADLEGAA
jgi:large subunit ribosomal protein L29